MMKPSHVHRMNVICVVTAFLITFLLTTCMPMIDDNLMLIVSDELPPLLAITSPGYGTPYVSEMAIEGTVIDSSVEEKDGKGALAALVLSFLDNESF
ncbi:MAG: hypothetical protein JW852_09775, partial [Spirochaetales bacterium]|nr:hypothetical protein [Spirochaetales bacterium]